MYQNINDFENLINKENYIEKIISDQDELPTLELKKEISVKKEFKKNNELKTNSKYFFSSYRKRYLLKHIFSYLNNNDKIQACFVNKLVFLQIRTELDFSVIYLFKIIDIG